MMLRGVSLPIVQPFLIDVEMKNQATRTSMKNHDGNFFVAQNHEVNETNTKDSTLLFR